MDNEDRRLILHGRLVDLFPTYGIFYNPPGDLLLSRPCIVYTDTQEEPSYANNLSYIVGTRFQVTVFEDLPGIGGLTSGIFDIPGITVNSNRKYITADVVHYVFNVSVNTI